MGGGFLAEWLPVVRQVFGQERVCALPPPRAAFVVPPGSPPEAEEAAALRASRPTVFFNACRSAGEIDWFSSGLEWATQFPRAGAGTFIGTLWLVRSDSALLFAESFYDPFISRGLDLGRASLHVRRAIRDQGGDPSWPAYAVYGSPAACAVVPKEADIR